MCFKNVMFTSLLGGECPAALPACCFLFWRHCCCCLFVQIFSVKNVYFQIFITADKRELWKKYTVTANGARRYVGMAVQTLFLLCLDTRLQVHKTVWKQTNQIIHFHTGRGLSALQVSRQSVWFMCEKILSFPSVCILMFFKKVVEEEE